VILRIDIASKIINTTTFLLILIIMPPKYICGPGKVKKTKQILLSGAYLLINDVVLIIPVYLDPMLRCVVLEPLKSIELKRYAWSWNYMPSEDLET
jgi:hypothetical protein